MTECEPGKCQTALVLATGEILLEIHGIIRQPQIGTSSAVNLLPTSRFRKPSFNLETVYFYCPPTQVPALCPFVALRSRHLCREEGPVEIQPPRGLAGRVCQLIRSFPVQMPVPAPLVLAAIFFVVVNIAQFNLALRPQRSTP